MVGVYRHDQLRLQHMQSSAVLASRSITDSFFGFVDVVIVNGFIGHKLKMEKEGKRVPTYA
ncbi:Hypothetical protein PHPALM_36554 [Phytophthora palmivora]|uniref:Uncharacterized protein n=1 Tax=Phytophthora palmivora TaxID=4796 RepID=A0A2P4WZM2_9STRA|nr:Hypothetical protein PHPALM_36554 [Phytophthora palmivora]